MEGSPVSSVSRNRNTPPIPPVSSKTSRGLIFFICRAGNFSSWHGKEHLPVQLRSRVRKRKEGQTRGAARMGWGQWPGLLDGPCLGGEGPG